MGTVSRRFFLAGSAAAVASAALPLRSARAAVASPTAAPALPPSSTAVTWSGENAVDYALRQGVDHWGEQLLAWPDGPSFDNVKPLLGPADIAGNYLTESGWYELPFTDVIYDPATWLQQRDFAMHVADGSQITSQWSWAYSPAAAQYTTFQVGSAYEVFGSAMARLDEPRLWGGYLPILDNAYTDADGTLWERESFAASVEATSALVSFLRFTVHRGRRGPAQTTLRLFFNVDNVADLATDGTRLTLGGNTYLVSSADGVWAQPNFDIAIDLTSGSAEVYLALLNTPAPAASLEAGQPTYQQAKKAVASYWSTALAAGASVQLPEPYAMDAMRSLLLQNLVMGWQQSIGDAYEGTDSSFAYIPEVSTSVAAFGELGFLDAYRDNLQQLLAKGQGPDYFPSWEYGIKMQSAANYYLLSNDASYISDNLATFQSWLEEFQQQRASDPNGLLAKQRYASDIVEVIYGIHTQSDGWRGMRDLGLALSLMGDAQDAQPFLDEAEALRTALVAAIDASSEQLPDGSIYVPVSLLDPTAPSAYDLISATSDGSYWNLIIPYALATGILPPGSAAANGMLRYLFLHGSLFLGLTRFNYVSIDPPGVVETDPGGAVPAGLAGYNTPGIDQQYGYSLLKFLGDNGEYDRLVMSFYGKLAHDLTPYTFICGEGATIAPATDLPPGFRSTYLPPLSANNAMYLRAVRETMIHEDRDADNGMPTVLHVAPATPRGWLADGERIAVSSLPTQFGPVTFSLVSQLRQGTITAVIEPPAYEAGRAPLGGLVLHVRTPAGWTLRSVTVNGQTSAFTGETVDLGSPQGRVTVALRYSNTELPSADQATPAAVLPARLLFQPGDVIPLQVSVEAIGDADVPGTLGVTTPQGWATPRPVPFTVVSAGRIASRSVSVAITVPSDAAPGRYDLTLTAIPRNGTPAGRTIGVEIAVPSDLPYPQLVEADNPSAYWRLDETSGTTADDYTGNGANGTYVQPLQLGQPGAIAGDQDGAVLLNGGYINIPDSPAVTLTGAFTIEAWIKVTTATAAQSLIEKYDTPANNGYLLRLVTANKLLAWTLDASEPPPSVTGPTSIVPGLWHHVAAVFDGTQLLEYLDGELQASVTTAAPTAGSGSLKLGASGDVAGNPYYGWLDEVAIYPQALTAEQLKAHFVKAVLGAPHAG